MIWVLTAGFGDGHNAAARGVGEALRRRCPDEPVVVEDWIATVHPFIAPLTMAAYRQLIVHCPRLWQWAYHYIASRPEAAVDGPGMKFMVEKLADELVRKKPRAIVSTYPLYSSLLQILKRGGMKVPPLLTVITDSVSIHPTWVVARSNWYAVADSESKAVMESTFGISPDVVEATGFPVSLKFAEPRPSRATESRRLLYLPSTPGPHVEQTLNGLGPLIEAGVEVTVVLGRHASRLHHRVQKFEDAYGATGRLTVMGWTKEIPALLQSHDLVITKAGGAITHELMAAGTPAIIDFVVPGQEEGNAQELLKLGGGAVSSSPAETAAIARSWLIDEPATLEKMKSALASKVFPDAALRVADLLLKKLEST